MARVRILLADDHEMVREGLKAILNAQSDMEVIGEAVDGRSAVALACQLSPDVVVMDVSMPHVNGLSATELLKESCPAMPVVALSRHSDEDYLRELLRAGAAGYVLKQSRSGELLQAIRAVAAGRSYVDPAITGNVICDSGAPPAAARLPPDASLSPREEETLRLVSLGYSNKEIASRLTLSVKTVETHKANGMHKLGFRSRIDIVRFAVLRDWLKEP
jgi:two-component system, NarL family, response regulator NreC